MFPVFLCFFLGGRMMKCGPIFWMGRWRGGNKFFFFAIWLAVGRWLYDNIPKRLTFIPSKKEISFSIFFTKLVGEPRRFATLLNPGFGSCRPYEVEVNLGRTFFLHVRVISFIFIVGWVGKIGALTLLSSLKKRSTTTFRNLEWCTNWKENNTASHGLCHPTTNNKNNKTTTANNNKTTKERERDKGGPFYQPYTLNILPFSVSRKPRWCPSQPAAVLWKRRNDGSWPSKWPSSFRWGWDPCGKWDPAIVWASVWGMFFFFQKCWM